MRRLYTAEPVPNDRALPLPGDAIVFSALTSGQKLPDLSHTSNQMQFADTGPRYLVIKSYLGLYKDCRFPLRKDYSRQSFKHPVLYLFGIAPGLR